MIKRLDYRGDLTNLRQLADWLARSGLPGEACWDKAERFAGAVAALAKTVEESRGRCLRALFVPGRIEVLGKHTDYAGGRSLIMAVEQGFSLVAVAREDRRVSVVDAGCGETISFDLDVELVPRVGHWSNYPTTVARRIARNFPEASRGAEIAFSSDLPPAAGMSSSSAMMVAVFLALADVNELHESGPYRENVHNLTDLAGYLGTVENGQTFGSLEGDRGVGTFGGSEDHTAMLCSRANRVSQYAYCPVRFERAIPVPAGYTFAVAASGVAAEKTGAAMEKYNAASRLASAIAELWRRETGRDDRHLADVNELHESGPYRENVHNLTDLAGYLGTVENGQTFGSLEGDHGVGTFGGSEDHTAMLCSRANRMSQYAYCPVRFERAIAVPAGYTFAVATSGVAAEKTGAAMEKYNAASRLASAVAELWREETGRDDQHLAAALDSGPKAAERLRSIVRSAENDLAEPGPLAKRLEHFLVESTEVLPAAGDALAQGDVSTFGRLVDRSQLAAEELLGNQIPETSYLARSARECGAAAASAFGAGFGGSVWALIEKSEAESFLATWAESYGEKFPETARAASFFTTTAGPAAFQVC
ncbi:MAG: galactokinase family protein [Planctomycetota bacterium]